MSGLMVLVKSMAQAQIGSATSPRFEVVSIKASNPSAPRPGRMGSVSVVTTPGFALELDMSPILEPAGGEQRPPTNEEMFEAAVNTIQNKLGLKLVQKKAPVEIFVVDYAQKPSEN